MSVVSSPHPSADMVADSHFAELPELCHTNDYRLMRLFDSSAAVLIAGNLYRLHPHSIFARTTFQASSPRVTSMIAERNQALTNMAWMNSDGLVLFQPIIPTNSNVDVMDQSLRSMAREIDQFGRKLRAIGIWEL